MNERRAVAAVAFAALLAACTAGTPAATPTPEPADPTARDTALIEEWFEATTNLEWDRSIELMTEEVRTPSGTLRDPDAIRDWFEGYPCLGEVESIEPMEGSPGGYAVMVRHIAWPDGRCDTEGEVRQYRVDVEDGEIARIP